MASIIAIYKRQNKRLKIVLQTLSCGLLIAILFFSGHLHGKSSAKAYVYVDVEKVMWAIVDSLDAGDLSADELNAQIDSSRQKFQELLEGYSAARSVMIIAKPKIISGVPDKTDFFIEKLLGGEGVYPINCVNFLEPLKSTIKFDYKMSHSFIPVRDRHDPFFGNIINR